MSITNTKAGQAAVDQANAIREALTLKATAIGNRTELSHAAMQSLTAKAYLAAKSQMDDLSASATTGNAAEIRALNNTAFGIDDIARPGSADSATASVSYRDAQDRVNAIETVPELVALQQRAEATGDVLLERAIALRAYTEYCSGAGWVDDHWVDLMNSYVAERPAAAAAIDALIEARRGISTVDIWAFALPVPGLIASMSPTQIQAAASNPAFANVGSAGTN